MDISIGEPHVDEALSILVDDLIFHDRTFWARSPGQEAFFWWLRGYHPMYGDNTRDCRSNDNCRRKDSRFCNEPKEEPTFSTLDLFDLVTL